MKLLTVYPITLHCVVAPLVGAWIEILPVIAVSISLKTSLPSWERGLKYYTSVIDILKRLSLPSWERGLKSFYLLSCLECLNVAPLVGAWIEILDLINTGVF